MSRTTSPPLQGIGERGAEQEAAWHKRFAAYEQAYPELAAALRRAWENRLPDGWDTDLPNW